jgi:hypothetical protein
MTKTQYYDKKFDMYQNGQMSIDDWKKFCFFFIITDKQWQDVVRRLRWT